MGDNLVMASGGPGNYLTMGGTNYTFAEINKASADARQKAEKAVAADNAAAANSFSNAVAAQFKKADWSGGTYQPLFKTPTGSNGNFKLTPGASGDIDIVNNFSWTLSKFRDEVPRIKLVEFQITKNQQLYNMRRKAALATSSDKADPYAGLFAAEETKFSYIFPHYDKSLINNSNSWDSKVPPEGVSLQKGVIESANKFASDIIRPYGFDVNLNNIDEAVIKARGMKGPMEATPFAGIEQPLYYSGTSRNKYTIKFPLFNNVSIDDVKRNHDFVRLFAYQNLKDRTSITTYNPPVYYKVLNVPGYMGSMGPKPAVWVSNFNVQHVGAVRAIDIGIGGRRVATPEAFLITIELTELIADSKQIFLSYLSGDDSAVNVQTPVA